MVLLAAYICLLIYFHVHFLIWTSNEVQICKDFITNI